MSTGDFSWDVVRNDTHDKFLRQFSGVSTYHIGSGYWAHNGLTQDGVFFTCDVPSNCTLR